jgi:hypothetical protein
MADVIGETSACRRCARPLDAPPSRRTRLDSGTIVGSLALGTVVAIVVALLKVLRG